MNKCGKACKSMKSALLVLIVAVLVLVPVVFYVVEHVGMLLDVSVCVGMFLYVSEWFGMFLKRRDRRLEK